MKTETQHTLTLFEKVRNARIKFLIKLMKNDGWATGPIDDVVRAVNSHDTMLNLLKGFVENLDLEDRHDVAQFSALVYKAIAQAEGK